MPAATVFADLSRALGARGGRGGSDGKTEKKREKTGERYEKLDVKMQCLLYILLRKIDS